MADSGMAARRGIVNQGTFFSPYYLFDLLTRQHADELDPQGREANRRLLRRPFRTAWARYGEGISTQGEAWIAWHRELFTALGFVVSETGAGAPVGAPLRRLNAPIDTPRHGRVPVSHAADLMAAPVADTFFELPDDTTGAERADGTDSANDAPLILVDLHGFGVDLDRDRYPQAAGGRGQGEITTEPIARAIEFALDASPARWTIVAAGERLRLYRKGGSVARQYLEVDFPALFDADRDDEWAAFWGLFRYAAFVPDAQTGKCLLDRVLEESQRHASRIADDLRENVVIAVEALIQGVLDDPANRGVIRKDDQQSVDRLFEETLYYLYRLLFVLYAESRDLLPVGQSLVYRDTYSVEHLRDLAERPLAPEDADRTYYADSLRTLFAMLRSGFPAVGPGKMNQRAAAPFTLPPFNGKLFDPRRTAMLDECRIPDRSLREVIRELSLSRPRRRAGDRRERYSYADLGVDQLGSIYEGLLVYEPAIVTEETVVAMVKGEQRLVSRRQAEDHDLEVLEDTLKRPGSFILRLWGGRRKGSGSYYTLQEITSFLVRQALEPLVEPIVRGCGERDKRGRPLRRPEEILDLKVCDPAMGSGAFLIQACRYLAEAYGRARIAAGLDDDGRLSQSEFAGYKRLVAERCLYGVDLNPLAVELAKVSLWLETLAVDRPLTFLDAHLRCGNSLVGAPLRDAEGKPDIARLIFIADAALEEPSREATAAQKAAARERIKRNREETKRLRPQRRGQQTLTGASGADWGLLSLREIEAALKDTLDRRRDLERSDEGLAPADAIELEHEKEEILDGLEHAAESRYRRARQLCDLWCATWFWPEPGSDIEVVFDGELRDVLVPEPPTTQVFLELAGVILGTDPGSLSDDDCTAYLATSQHVARRQRFFHWELEFPEVWRERDGAPKANGGFDAQAGNPPWDVVKPNSQEFWSNYDPLFRELGKQEALNFAEEMRADPDVDRAWRVYDRNMAQTGRFFKESSRYSHQGRGDINTYKLFVERSLTLLREGGGLGLVLPSSIYSDLGSRELRLLLFDTCQVRSLLAFTNEKFIFPAVHHAFRFALLSAQRGGRTETMPALFRLNVRNAVAPDELPALLANLDAATLKLRIEDIRRFSPDSLSLMELRSQRDVDVAARIYGHHPLLGEDVPSAWKVRFTRELDMTNDSRLFRTLAWLEAHGCVEQPDRTWLGPDGERYLPLYEGKTIYQFNPAYERFGYWVAETGFRASKANPSAKVSYRLIASSTNEMTLISALLPRDAPAGNSLAAQVAESMPDGEQQLYVCACLNSFVLNSAVRQKVQANLNMFIVGQLPLPRKPATDITYQKVVGRAAYLSCTQPGLAEVWDAVAGRFPALLPAPWRPRCATIDPHERAQLRAEIDALVADLYGLPEADFVYILTTFPLLDRDQPALPGEPKSFITRDLALLELFKLRQRQPPEDVVAFFAEAGADIAGATGPVRDLAERVRRATELGAVAYVPSGRGGAARNGDDDEPEAED